MKNFTHCHYYQGIWIPRKLFTKVSKVVWIWCQVLTSDFYFPFPDFADTVGNVLGSRKVGVGNFYDGQLEIVREKSILPISFRQEFCIFPLNAPLGLRAWCCPCAWCYKPLAFWCYSATESIGYKIFVDSHQDFIVESFRNKFLIGYIMGFGPLFIFIYRKGAVPTYLPLHRLPLNGLQRVKCSSSYASYFTTWNWFYFYGLRLQIRGDLSWKI